MAGLLGSTWLQPDSRASSTHSLAPSPETPTDGRRKLLLIYVHGFMGDETSFQRFPAHVHHYLAEVLQRSHIVHTKVYPRYKTRHKIEEVKYSFSNWLAPHERPDQDIILLGHSMGGILTAEVVLLRHRILGTINFDVPFLGLHPGVVGAGLGSLVRPRQKPSRSPSPVGKSDGDPLQTESSHQPDSDQHATQVNESSASLASTGGNSFAASQSSIALSVPENDPHFNPSFTNDVVLQKRTRWSNLAHFFHKHSNDLLYAAESLVTSHLEFGGAMADYRALKKRYAKIRALEDSVTGDRVRFVNYYTACTGRPKVEKPSKDEEATAKRALEPDNDTQQASSEGHSNVASFTGQGSFDKQSQDESQDDSFAPNELEDELPATQSQKDDAESRPSQTSNADQDLSNKIEGLAPPRSCEAHSSQETIGDLSHVLELSQEERRAQLASADAPTNTRGNDSDQNKPISSPGYVGDNLACAEDVNNERAMHDETKDERRARRKAEKAMAKKARPPKDRKFCLLPSKIDGQRDPCWIRVFMTDTDEVGAHCGLFSMDEDPQRYQLFVYDVSCKMLDWLHCQ